MKCSVQRMATWLKVNPIRKVIAALLIGLVSVFIWGKVMDGIKVIDPSDPRFNPERFRFEDYAGLHTDPEPKMFTPALLKMFPPGTDEAYVDKILVERAGAEKHDYRGDAKGYRYYKPALGGLTGWVVIVIYNENGKSTDLKNGPKQLYSQSEH